MIPSNARIVPIKFASPLQLLRTICDGFVQEDCLEDICLFPPRYLLMKSRFITSLPSFTQLMPSGKACHMVSITIEIFSTSKSKAGVFWLFSPKIVSLPQTLVKI